MGLDVKSLVTTAITTLALLTTPVASTLRSRSSASNAAQILGLTPFPSEGSLGADDLTIDLGYGIYKGTVDDNTHVRSWKGIPFAEPPTGSLRWQKPQPPTGDPSAVHDATKYGPQCPQSPPSMPGQTFNPGNEDCLYVNVYSPDSTSSTVKKPVLVWIHGGGYGQGNGANDLSGLIVDNNNEFVAVTIQYRLGALGFLGSEQVKANGGLLNAGLIDQAYALIWVQNYISLFGGDPSQVTITGESSGGGSVMHHTLAEGGNTDLVLFQNAIAASPYMPQQFAYDAAMPTQNYNDFAATVGCTSSSPTEVWQCLVAADSETLQRASFNVSTGLAMFGTWAFTPVTDGTFIQQLASEQLAAKQVLGKTVMVGNNADEAPLFVPGGIDSDDKLVTWLHSAFPGLSSANITELLALYSTAGTGPGGSSYPLDGPAFETDGVNWPTANDVSLAAVGPQQRAYNIYSEATFTCSAYFLAEAYTAPGKKAYQYQYSVPFASHNADVGAYIGPALSTQSPDFVKAFRQIWGGVVVRSNPSILNGGGSSPYIFPAWSSLERRLVNLNTTGGTASTVSIWGRDGTIYVEPGLQNLFKTADADSWEGDRGRRCDFWQSVAPFLPQ
ncbi:inactive carboxylesterase 4 [Ophiostoma piceae UAMH 11346]|uniref:Carboxylic ester hydrolase n=1 Tax=Ophiostoma piceae (strain UAMH 11346) TaxID=1262450 RepID=S3DBE1_OPHP1|nr:inactive carboxylesterase 4 [Ophiostoma piceae UAMH 11346]